jgi:hypothetical protein
MRLIIDSLVALMLAGILAGVVMHNRQREERAGQINSTRDALHQIEQHLKVQIALEKVELTDAGWPRTIDPEWFPLQQPRNLLLSEGRTWVEVVGPQDRHMRHPRTITGDDRALAAFWYNPYQGIVRARIPAGITDVETVSLYNQVNGTTLSSIVSEYAE